MGNISIVEYSSIHAVANQLGWLAISNKLHEEMGESIRYDEGQRWYFAFDSSQKMLGFICFNSDSILYAYVLPGFRGTGIFSKLFDVVPASVNKVVASNMSLPIFLKKGFKIKKSYKICHKLIR